MRKVGLIFLFFILLAASAIAWLKFQPQKSGHQVSLTSPLTSQFEQVLPQNYQIKLSIAANSQQVSGQVAITLNLMKPLSLFRLQASNSHLDWAKLVLATGEVVDLKMENPVNGYITLKSSRVILPGQTTLVIQHQTDLAHRFIADDTSMRKGPYLYQLDQQIFFTGYFPYLPTKVKTPIQLIVTAPESMHVSSHEVSVGRDKLSNGDIQQTFAMSKAMYIEQFMLVVGSENNNKSSVLVRTDSQKQPLNVELIDLHNLLVNPATLAEQIASQATQLAAYFMQPLTSSKLQVLVIPSQQIWAEPFAGGVFLSQSLVANLTVQQSPDNLLAHYLLAHAIAQQWLGIARLTIEKQDWLLAEALIFDAINWSWQDSMLAQKLDAQINRTRVQNMQGIVNENGAPWWQENVVAPYHDPEIVKLQSVLRMLVHFIDQDWMRKQLAVQLTMDNAEEFVSAQFFARLATSANISNLDDVVRSFSHNNDLPTVSVNYHCRNNSIAVKLMQVNATTEQYWTLPVCLRLFKQKDSTSFCALMTAREIDFSANVNRCPIAVMPNADGIGLYFWQLNAGEQQALLAQLGKMSAAEQSALVLQIVTAYYDGRLDIQSLLNVFKQVLLVNNWQLTEQFMPILIKLDRYLLTSQQQAALRQFIEQELALKLSALFAEPNKFNNLTHQQQLAITSVAEQLLITFKSPILLRQFQSNTLSAELSQLETELATPISASPWRKFALVSQFTGLTEQQFTTMLERALSTNNSQQRQLLLTSLIQASTAEQIDEIVSKLINLRLSRSVRQQLLVILSQQNRSQSSLFNWLIEKQWWLMPMLQQQELALLPLIGIGLCTADEQTRFQQLLQPYSQSSAQFAARMERVNIVIDRCVAWRNSQPTPVNLSLLFQ